MKNLSIFFICLLLVAPCFARTITVDDDGFADFNNIQAAISFDAAQDRFNRSLHFGQIQSGLRSR